MALQTILRSGSKSCHEKRKGTQKEVFWNTNFLVMTPSIKKKSPLDVNPTLSSPLALLGSWEWWYKFQHRVVWEKSESWRTLILNTPQLCSPFFFFFMCVIFYCFSTEFTKKTDAQLSPTTSRPRLFKEWKRWLNRIGKITPQHWKWRPYGVRKEHSRRWERTPHMVGREHPIELERSTHGKGRVFSRLL